MPHRDGTAQLRLIGRQLIDDQGRTLTVVGPVSWSQNYLELRGDDEYRTVRSAALLQLKFAR